MVNSQLSFGEFSAYELSGRNHTPNLEDPQNRKQNERIFLISYFIFNLCALIAVFVFTPTIPFILMNNTGSSGWLLVCFIILFNATILLLYYTSSCIMKDRYIKVGSSSLKTLKHVESYVERMKESPSIMKISISCFHYSSRTNIAAGVNKKGRIRVKNRRIKITSFENTKKMKFKSWEDYSELSPNLQSFSSKLCRFKTSLHFITNDEETKQVFNKKKEKFLASHKLKDKYYEWKIFGFIDQCQPEEFCFSKTGSIPFYFSKFSFYFFSIFMMGAFYRLIFLRSFKVVHFLIKKNVSRNNDALSNKIDMKYKAEFSSHGEYEDYQKIFQNMYMLPTEIAANQNKKRKKKKRKKNNNIVPLNTFVQSSFITPGEVGSNMMMIQDFPNPKNDLKELKPKENGNFFEYSNRNNPTDSNYQIHRKNQKKKGNFQSPFSSPSKVVISIDSDDDSVEYHSDQGQENLENDKRKLIIESIQNQENFEIKNPQVPTEKQVPYQEIEIPSIDSL